MRTLYDSQDFSQAVWGTFYARVDELTQFDSPEPLIRYLTRVAHNKVIDQYRRRSTRDLKGHRLDSAHDVPAPSTPTPSENAMANESWDNLVDGQPKPLTDIANLRREGRTAAEIAAELGLSISKVRRSMAKLRDRARRQQRDDDSGDGQ